MKSIGSTFIVTFMALLLGMGCASTSSSVAENSINQEETPSSMPVVSDTDMTAEQVLASHVEAKGGMEKIKAIQSIMWDAEAQTMGMQLPLTVYVKRPGMIRTEVFVPQMNAEIVTGFDGTSAWTSNPMAGGAAMDLPKSQAESLADQADLDGLLIRFMADKSTLKYEGSDQIEGNAAHKFTVNREGKSTVVIYLDAETLMETRVESEGMDPQTGSLVPTVMDMSDYREVEGVMMAHTIHVELNGQPFQELTIKEIKANITINEQIFKKP